MPSLSRSVNKLSLSLYPLCIHLSIPISLSILIQLFRDQSHCSEYPTLDLGSAQVIRMNHAAKMARTPDQGSCRSIFFILQLFLLLRKEPRKDQPQSTPVLSMEMLRNRIPILFLWNRPTFLGSTMITLNILGLIHLCRDVNQQRCSSSGVICISTKVFQQRCNLYIRLMKPLQHSSNTQIPALAFYHLNWQLYK